MIKHVAEGSKFLEIGSGIGVGLIEALIQKKCQLAVGSDILEAAVENTQENLQRFNL